MICMSDCTIHVLIFSRKQLLALISILFWWLNSYMTFSKNIYIFLIKVKTLFSKLFEIVWKWKKKYKNIKILKKKIASVYIFEPRIVVKHIFISLHKTLT